MARGVRRAEAPAGDVERGDRLWRRAAEVAVIMLAVLASFAVLSWAGDLILPLVAGVVFGMILGPIADRAQRVGIPAVVTNFGILLLLALAVYGATLWFLPTISEWLGRLPELAQQVREKVVVVERAGAMIDEIFRLIQRPGSGPTVQMAPERAAVVTTVFSAVTPAFAQLVVFTFTLMLFLIGRKQLKARLVLAMPSRARRLTMLHILSAIEDQLLGYFAVMALINAGVAVITTLALLALGVPAAPVWGFLAFVLNFLPVVGPMLLIIGLIGMGVVVMPTLTAALLPALAFLIVTTIEGNLITPRVIGRRLTLEPLVVFIAMSVFTWLWGPVGAFLSTPLVIIAISVQAYVAPTDDIDLPP